MRFPKDYLLGESIDLRFYDSQLMALTVRTKKKILAGGATTRMRRIFRSHTTGATLSLSFQTMEQHDRIVGFFRGGKGEEIPLAKIVDPGIRITVIEREEEKEGFDE